MEVIVIRACPAADDRTVSTFTGFSLAMTQEERKFANLPQDGIPGINFNCPACNRPLGCSEDDRGRHGACPRCGHRFFAPLTTVDGRGTAGSELIGAIQMAMKPFEDRGIFQELQPEEHLRERREKREESKRRTRERRRSKWRRRVEAYGIPLALAAAAVITLRYFYLSWTSAHSKELAKLEAIADEGQIATARFAMAKETARSFLNAPTLEEQLSLARDPDRVEPLMRRFHARGGFTPFRFIDFVDQSTTGRNWAYFDVAGFNFILAQMEDLSVRMLLLEDKGDEFKVDWESLVVYGEMEWDEFLRERPTHPVLMRPIVSPSNYYNYEFSDSDQWASFMLRDAMMLHLLYAYAKRDSPITGRLEAGLASQGTMWPVLKLKWLENSKGRNQVEIVEILSDRWIFD